MVPGETEKLLPYRRVPREPAVRLLCFPFAGGTAASYREWGTLLPPSFDVCAIELPGRGLRLREPAIANMDRLVDYVAKSLEALFDRPVILFGHSLGARVGFALARRVPSVAGLVASASVAAHLPPRKQRSVLSRDALIKELAELGGTPQQVLSDTELMDIFLPTIRADFSLLERGVAPAGATVSCPILALASRADREVAFEDAQAWASCTTSHFEWVEMSGGHFYMQANREAILAGIRRAAARWAPHSARID